jgi:hypothetical protein
VSHPLPNRAAYFVDISDNNPLPNLEAYRAAGHEWIAVKLTEGIGYVWHGSNLIADEWHRLGGRVLHYAWPRADAGPTTAQADYFLGALDGHFTDGDATMNDWEASMNYQTRQYINDGPENDWAARIALFNDRLHAAHGAHCVYTGNWYLDGKPRMQAEARRWPVILSDYTGGDGEPNNRLNLRIWARQFTSSATVPGIRGHVDYNHILDPTLTPGTDKFDLLEWIMSLPGAPADLTYQQFLDAIALRVLHIDAIPNPSADPKSVHDNPTWTLASYQEQLYKRETQDIELDRKA